MVPILSFEGIEGLIMKDDKLFYKDELVGEYHSINQKSFFHEYRGLIHLYRDVREIITLLEEKKYYLTRDCGLCI